MKINATLWLAFLTGLLVACGGGGGGGSTTQGGGTTQPPSPIQSQLPTAFWVSQPVGPNETLLVTGGNLDTSTRLELAPLPDDAPGSPALLAPTIAHWTELPLLTATARSLTATVPASWDAGVYAVRLSSGTNKGSLLRVNAPDPWFVQGDQGDTAQPGGYLLVAGATLERIGGLGPRAALVDRTTGAPVVTLSNPERVTTSTGYALRFALPDSTPEGEYALWLHNGRGGAAAWVKFSTFIAAPLDTVTIRKAATWPASTVDVSVQAGATADEKFANAIAAVSAAGGRIRVPAGTYTLTKPLALPNHTVLAGVGRASTLIKWDIDPKLVDPTVTALVQGKAHATFGIEDLSLQASAASYAGSVVERVGTREPGWLKRVGIITQSTAETDWGKVPTALFLRQTANTVLEDLLIDSARGIYARDDVSYLRLTGSTIRWNNLNIWLSGQSHNFLIAGNSFEKRGPLLAQCSLCLSMAYGEKGPYARDILWTGNTLTQISGDPIARRGGYTMDGGDGIYLGGVASTRGTTLNLTGLTASTNITGKPVTYAWAGAIAQILDGRGAGQWRYLTEASQGASSIQVDRPWEIEPDGTSTLSLVNMQGRILMIDNDYIRDTQHDDYYLAVDSIKAGNKFGVAGEITAATTWTGRHYQGTFPAWHLQFLGNQISRGAETRFSSMVSNTPASPYRGVVGAGHVYRNNTNTSGGLFNLYLRSNQGRIADVVFEHNQASGVFMRGQTTEAINLSGVLVRGNTMPSGTPSAVVPTGVIEGVTVAP